MSTQIVKGFVQGLQPSPRAAVVLDSMTFATGLEDFQFSTDSLPGQQKSISAITTIWIDARNFAAGKNLVIKTQLETFVIQGGNSGYFAVTSPLPFTIDITSPQGALGTVLVNLMNFDVTPGQTQNTIQITGVVGQNIQQVGGVAITLGQAVRAASIPVTLASDQPALPTTIAGAASKFTAALLAVATAVKAGAGSLIMLTIGNSGAALAYVQVFDRLVGGVVLGVTVPDFAFLIPAGQSVTIELGNGVQFATGITVAATTLRGNAVAPASALDVNAAYN